MNNEKKKTLSVDPGQSVEIDRNVYSTRAPPGFHLGMSPSEGVSEKKIHVVGL